MHVTLDKFYGNQNDFKLCKECHHPNWYDNESCVMCPSTEFKECGDGIIEHIDEEYRFYMEEEGYTESEVDNIEKDV